MMNNNENIIDNDETKHENNTTIPFSIVFILDKSGSMENMGKEPVDGLNNFYKEQNENGKFFSTLILFNHKSEIIHENIEGESVKRLEYSDYKPDGMTALYDAIGHGITKQESVKKENVIFVILTDGHENSSREYNRKEIKEKINKAEKEYGWKFIYLGANQDSFEVGNSIGISTSCDYNYTKAGCREIFREVSSGLSKCISHEVPTDLFSLNPVAENRPIDAPEPKISSLLRTTN